MPNRHLLKGGLMGYPYAPVLLIDDETQVLDSTLFSLKLAGIDAQKCSDSRAVPDILRETAVSVILLDLLMPYKTGYELLPEIRETCPDSPIIVMTAVNEVESAVGCMKNGAFDYLLKPVRKEELLASIKKAIDCWEMGREHSRLSEYFLSGKFENPDAFADIVTRNEKMISLFRYLEAIAPSPMPILITGESGVGKELFARAAHAATNSAGPFVAVNVAGLDDVLFTDTLFGHKPGAFTGASSAREGLVRAAEGGTLFLDEIGDLSKESQVKLLRLLEDRTYYQTGSDSPQKSNARVVAATNRSIDSLRSNPDFRNDLYYRLKTHHVHIPPLRERKDDIPLLTDTLIARIAQELGKPTPTPPRELYTLLKTHPFPGNVRELKSVLYDAVSRHSSRMLSLQPIREALGVPEPTGSEENEETGPSESPVTFGSRLPTIRELNELVVEEALKRADGNQGLAARMIGITRSALNKRLNKPV